MSTGIKHKHTKWVTVRAAVANASPDTALTGALGLGATVLAAHRAGTYKLFHIPEEHNRLKVRARGDTDDDTATVIVYLFDGTHNTSEDDIDDAMPICSSTHTIGQQQATMTISGSTSYYADKAVIDTIYRAAAAPASTQEGADAANLRAQLIINTLGAKWALGLITGTGSANAALDMKSYYEG